MRLTHRTHAKLLFAGILAVSLPLGAYSFAAPLQVAQADTTTSGAAAPNNATLVDNAMAATNAMSTGNATAADNSMMVDNAMPAGNAMAPDNTAAPGNSAAPDNSVADADTGAAALPAPFNTWPGADAASATLLADADVERGKAVFQKVGICVSCHGWNGNGLGKNPRSEGLAAKLRDTQLDTETLIATVRCGIPGTPMPYHDSAAYKDADKCYGMTMADFDKGSEPRRGHTFPEKDILNVVAYIEAKVKGRPETTLADCQDYFGASASKACTQFEK